MSLKLQSKSLFFLSVLCFSLLSDAQEMATAKTAEASESLEKKFIESNIAVSNWLDRVAEQIDLFLVGRRLTNRRNGTSVKIQNSSFTTEGKPLVNSFSIGLNPRFPNLEEFLQVKFTTNEDRNEQRKTVSESSNERQTEKNYSSSTALFKKLGSVQTTFQPRIGLGNPIKLSHSLNFESALKFKTSILNPKLEFFADADRGVGVFDAINYQFNLSKTFTLTLINDGEYLDRDHTYTVNNGFSLGQMINQRTDFAYSLIFTSGNRPSYHLDNYTFAFAWNQQYYKRILNLQFIPQLDFQKVNHYKGSAGFTFNLSLLF